MKIEKIHHVAYRCKDARLTADFYERVLKLKLVGAVSADHVPSTLEPDTYMSALLETADGCVVAFFEVPGWPPMKPNDTDPLWLQHIAFQVKDVQELDQAKARLEAEGLEVLGPVDHKIFKSIYFLDPNGHRLEIAVWSDDLSQMQTAAAAAPAMLEEWSRTKRPPQLPIAPHN